MVWATLIFLGVPIWLVVGALVGGSMSRRRFQQSEGVFALRVRKEGDKKFSNMRHARWVHDVMLVNSGFALVRTEPYPIKSLAEFHGAVDAIKGLGNRPVTFSLESDDGTVALFATSGENSERAIGPFWNATPNRT